MSPSQVFRSADRAEEAQLASIGSHCRPGPGHTKDQTRFWPIRANLKEFLIHGVKYAFPRPSRRFGAGNPNCPCELPRSANRLPNPLSLRLFGPIPRALYEDWSSPRCPRMRLTAARRDPKLYELPGAGGCHSRRPGTRARDCHPPTQSEDRRTMELKERIDKRLNPAAKPECRPSSFLLCRSLPLCSIRLFLSGGCSSRHVDYRSGCRARPSNSRTSMLSSRLRLTPN